MKGVYKEILSESELPEVESELPIAVSFDNSGQTDI
jgi:hypothetical protein